MSALDAAVNTLNERLVMADCIGESFQAAAGEASPPWVFVFREQVEAIRQAAEAVETLISRGVQ